MPLLAELVDLVLPRLCVHCGVPAASQWCVPCRGEPTLLPCGLIDHMPVVAAADYEGGLRAALLSYKERGQRRLLEPLSDFLLTALAGLEVSADERLLVPIPSARGAARQRGGDHMLRLANCAARRAHAKPQPVPPRHLGVAVRPVLRVRRSGLDSAALTAEQRQLAQQGRLAASTWSPSSGNRHVVLVDDIMTTGATLQEGCRALTEAGWYVDGAAVIARTVRRFAPAD